MIKPLLLLTVVLFVPIVMLVVSGEAFIDVISRWQVEPPSRLVVFASVVAILASDVFLPIPSGPISTLAGSQLGVLGGTASAAIGMTLGATIAYGLARRYGRPLAQGLSSPERLAVFEADAERHGPWMLALTRPLPIIAEAAALLAGMLRMPAGRFYPAVVLTNIAIAAAYSVLGAYALDRGWLPLAIAASVAVPLSVTAAVFRRRSV
jgi:uncharacterized membrane protein YdjX (TVP38/TMEM64 family)